MQEHDWLAEQFENQRGHLRAVAYRMLGSTAEADDAVQDTWFRLTRSDTSEVENLKAWMTTITARICLNMLRSRKVRSEDPFDTALPDPVIGAIPQSQPEDEAILADSVSLALLVVLDTLSPSERLAFVLHDIFELPFEDIAPMVERTPAAARQLASRARRRIKGADVPAPDGDLTRQREVVDAFFRAAREGNFEKLVTVLHQDVVLRTDFGGRRPAASGVVRGAAAVADQAIMFANPVAVLNPALVNGAAGVVVTIGGRPTAIMGFIVRENRIVAIDAIADPDRVSRITAGFAIPQ
jgi:RNA polymerase sigma-70 factor (ECF subfamily)